jgi:hypothetical protein
MARPLTSDTYKTHPDTVYRLCLKTYHIRLSGMGQLIIAACDRYSCCYRTHPSSGTGLKKISAAKVIAHFELLFLSNRLKY